MVTVTNFKDTSTCGLASSKWGASGLSGKTDAWNIIWWHELSSEYRVTFSMTNSTVTNG